MEFSAKNELEKLIKGCVKGERKCQQKIYELYYGKMLGVCLRYAGNRDDAKDILQDGFIKVFANIKNYNWSGPFEGWVRRIIVNTAIDVFRKNRSSIIKVDSEIVDAIKEDSYEEIENDKFQNISFKDVLKEVQNLSPAYRAVFSLYIVDGYTHKEIAEELGISEGTSKSNLAKAKRNLKKALSYLIEDEVSSRQSV
ncbi:MAG: RNA polymerase subunit sigma-70 [Flavobacteriales bacterium]|nr:MAG: RNA polymerase subunit sigma-70 [Flavobacteriales bacterium]